MKTKERTEMYKSNWLKKLETAGNLPAASAKNLAKADRIALAAETEWETWGHWLVEAENLEALMGFKNKAEAKRFGEALNEIHGI